MLARTTRYLSRMLSIPARSFSSQQKLVKILQSELKLEKEQYAIDESIGSFLQENSYSIVEKENSIEVSLKRTINGFDVQVYFLARPFDNNEEQYEEDRVVQFSVVVSKPGQKKGVLYECEAGSQDLVITNVAYANDISKLDKLGSLSESFDYRGPEFDTLDEKLQQALYENLKDFGINDSLIEFIENYSVDREQRLYMEWLKSLKEFVG